MEKSKMTFMIILIVILILASGHFFLARFWYGKELRVEEIKIEKGKNTPGDFIGIIIDEMKGEK